jgi:formate hydrogenlyase subunit 3/multisubunit Na+/H+ antiporter MnhD subunit
MFSTLLASLALLILSSILVLLNHRSCRLTRIFGPGGILIASVVGLVTPIQVLLTGTPFDFHASWHVPFGSFHIGVDPLSALFLIIIFALAPIISLYAIPYLHDEERFHELAPHYCFLSLLVASMFMVTIARNLILFLVAWEFMSVTSYLLVIHNKRDDKVRHAGVVYLVASQIGAAFLITLIMLLVQKSGSFDFSLMGNLRDSHEVFVRSVFICSIVGFGIKAGFVPLHIWLPEAHPAAPSHISALMSGVMIKMGLYGILRIVVTVGMASTQLGYPLLVIGIITGLTGIILSLGQSELKRILAYSSIENMGIIAIGLGLGFIGIKNDNMMLALLGLTGALLHFINHAFAKGLLFLCAGYILHATHGIRSIDQMGGLWKRMPTVGKSFLIAALSVSGVPPFSGFMSEFLIYFAAYYTLATAQAATLIPAIFGLGALTLIGVLAIYRFITMFTIIFQGAERKPMVSSQERASLEPSFDFKIPLLILVVLCIILAFTAPLLVLWLAPVVHAIFIAPIKPLPLPELNALFDSMVQIVTANLTLIALVVLALTVRKAAFKSKVVRQEVTWDCGYIRPTSRMQYSGSSMVQPALLFISNMFRTKIFHEHSLPYFPRSSELKTPDHNWDRYVFAVYHHMFIPLEKAFEWIRKLQNGKLQVYILYIIITLLVLLMWHLGI